MPAGVLFGTFAATAALYAVVSVWAFQRSRLDPSPRLRTVALILVLSSSAIAVSSLLRLGTLAARSGWLSITLTDDLLAWWQLTQSLVLLGMGALAIRIIRPIWSGISHSERVTAALGSTEPIDVSGLTPRELEVLEAISVGRLSDKELAAELGVSRYTAKTHVARILSKTGLHSRAELLAAAAALHGESTGRARNAHVRKPTG